MERYILHACSIKIKVLTNTAHWPSGHHKMQLRAYTSIYWPTIKLLTMFNHVFLAKPEVILSKRQAISMEVLGRPWKTLGMDILLVVDYNSKFPCVQKLSATSTYDASSALSFCFSVHGTPARSTVCHPLEFHS